MTMDTLREDAIRPRLVEETESSWASRISTLRGLVVLAGAGAILCQPAPAWAEAPVDAARSTATPQPTYETSGRKTAPIPEAGFPIAGAASLYIAGAASLGSCGRVDPALGATGACGDATLGVTLLDGESVTRRGRPSYRGPRFGLEAGAGFEPSTSQGFADIAFAQSSGGPYFVLRALAGYDWTQLFFTTGGAQVRFPLAGGAPGYDAILELGTRIVAARWEVGVRQQLGVDGVTSSGSYVPDGSNGPTTAFAYGTSLFTRVMWP